MGKKKKKKVEDNRSCIDKALTEDFAWEQKREREREVLVKSSDELTRTQRYRWKAEAERQMDALWDSWTT